MVGGQLCDGGGGSNSSILVSQVLLMLLERTITDDVTSFFIHLFTNVSLYLQRRIVQCEICRTFYVKCLFAGVISEDV